MQQPYEAYPLLGEMTENLRTRTSYFRKDRNQWTYFLKEVEPGPLIWNSFGHVIKAIERKASLVDLCVTIGRRVLQKLERPKTSVASCQVGWAILISYFEQGLLGFSKEPFIKKNGKRSKFLTYSLVVKDRKALFGLWDEINSLAEQVDIFPSDQPMPKWTSGVHPTGNSLIKKAETELLDQLSPEKQPIVFEALNKLGSTALRISLPVLEVLNHFLEQEDGPENPIPYKRETDRERRGSLKIIADSIAKLANKFKDRSFYDLYNCDFR